MVVDEVCSRGGGNVTTRAAHMSSGTRLRCRSIARSSHGPRRAVGQQGGRSVSNRRRGGAGLTTFFILCESGGTDEAVVTASRCQVLPRQYVGPLP